MTAKRWGDQWYFPIDAPPQLATHLRCGQRLNAALRCGVCHETLAAIDVTADRGNWRAPHAAR